VAIRGGVYQTSEPRDPIISLEKRCIGLGLDLEISRVLSQAPHSWSKSVKPGGGGGGGESTSKVGALAIGCTGSTISAEGGDESASGGGRASVGVGLGPPIEAHLGSSN